MSLTMKRVLSVAAAAVCVAGLVWVLFWSFGGKGGGLAPGKPQVRELTCTNEQCPGKPTYHDPQTGQSVTVPYTESRTLPAGFSDWPLECPKCRQQTLYMFLGCGACERTFKAKNLSDVDSYTCPHCGFNPYK